MMMKILYGKGNFIGKGLRACLLYGIIILSGPAWAGPLQIGIRRFLDEKIRS